MRYGRFTDGIYCADEITTQLAGLGIPDSQSMALGEIGSNGRFINISGWLGRAVRLGGGRVQERWQGAGWDCGGFVAP